MKNLKNFLKNVIFLTNNAELMIFFKKHDFAWVLDGMKGPERI